MKNKEINIFDSVWVSFALHVIITIGITMTVPQQESKPQEEITISIQDIKPKPKPKTNNENSEIEQTNNADLKDAASDILEKLTKQEKAFEDPISECTSWYGGIGILVKTDKDKTTSYKEVSGVFPGYPADKAGIMAGDIVTENGGVITPGDVGSAVNIEIKRGNVIITKTLIREKICLN